MQSINETLTNLACAYGGYSQFGNKDIGKALAGQYNNATSWPRPAGLAKARIEEAAREMTEYWEDCGVEYEHVLNEIEYGYMLFVLGIHEQFPRSNIAAELLADWDN
jgi:hypothetical protein